MNEFLQQIINGISLGAIYALIALGYTLVFGVLRFINFAHSDVFMVGAYIGYYSIPRITNTFGEGSVTSIIVLIITMIACGLLGMLIEYLVYRPLRDRPKLTVLITAIGVSLFLEYTGQLPQVFGADYKTFPTLIPNTVLFNLGSIPISLQQTVVVFVSVGLMYVLRIIVMKTKVGTAMRAVSMNLNAASLMGINTNRIITFTFFIGSSLAGAGAILFASTYPKINPLMGVLPGLKAFVAAVVGGIGNIPGAALGGFLIGIVETLTAGYISPTFKDAIGFSLLIIILLFKPSGLLGKAASEKV